MDINKIIYEVKGRKVILVKDVAKLLGMNTKRINEIVKRNFEKFSNENYFQLIKEEYEVCVQGHKLVILNDNFVTSNDNFATSSCFATSSYKNNNAHGDVRYLPFVFTIDGIKVLKRTLKSKEMDVIFNKIIEVLEAENNTLVVPSSKKFREENIKSMIYEIRGKQVMFDFDLAVLYECKNGTKEINQAVKNNMEKFPERFSWFLNDYECESFLVKSFDQKIETRGGRYKNPRVFTEEGIVMLATILKSHVAIQVSIAIMDTFVAMRKYISNDLIEQKYINNLVLEDHDKIALLQESFLSFEEKKKTSEIYFNGQIYDAYSKIVDLMKEAKKELIIIDNYADK